MACERILATTIVLTLEIATIFCFQEGIKSPIALSTIIAAPVLLWPLQPEPGLIFLLALLGNPGPVNAYKIPNQTSMQFCVSQTLG